MKIEDPNFSQASKAALFAQLNEMRSPESLQAEANNPDVSKSTLNLLTIAES